MWYLHYVERDDQRAAIDAIVAVGRRTRKPTPRWLWIAAAIAGAIGVIGFAIAMLFPASEAVHGRLDLAQRAGGAVGGSGFGSGLAIGAVAGIAIGIWIGRQRLSHSSRNSP